jgi:5-methylcytosine-specific restriction endonuclease McrA
MCIRPKDRFLTFRRDNFTCRYCGRRPPEVVLECDHIIPRAKGGPDTIDNYITACRQCNGGKGVESPLPPTNEHTLRVLGKSELRNLAAEIEKETGDVFLKVCADMGINTILCE